MSGFFSYMFSFQDRLILVLWCISVSMWPKSPEVIHWLLYTADLVAPTGQDIQIVACKPSYAGSHWLPEPPVWVELQSWAKREGSRSACWCPEQRTALWACPGWHMPESCIFGPRDVQCLETVGPDECRLVEIRGLSRKPAPGLGNLLFQPPWVSQGELDFGMEREDPFFSLVLWFSSEQTEEKKNPIQTLEMQGFSLGSVQNSSFLRWALRMSPQKPSLLEVVTSVPKDRCELRWCCLGVGSMSQRDLHSWILAWPSQGELMNLRNSPSPQWGNMGVDPRSRIHCLVTTMLVVCFSLIQFYKIKHSVCLFVF